MKHLGPLVVGLLLLGVLGWECYSGPSYRAAWEADTARTFQGVQAREDSAEAMLQLGMRLVEQGEQAKQEALKLSQRGERAYRSALNLRDSLESVAIPDTCLPLARGWAMTVDSLVVARQSDSAAFVALEASLAQMDSAYWSQTKRAELYRESVDSLSAIVRRAPGDCKLLSVIPCPSLTVGYGVVENDGIRTGLGATFGWSIPLGRR